MHLLGLGSKSNVQKRRSSTANSLSCSRGLGTRSIEAAMARLDLAVWKGVALMAAIFSR